MPRFDKLPPITSTLIDNKGAAGEEHLVQEIHSDSHKCDSPSDGKRLEEKEGRMNQLLTRTSQSRDHKREEGQCHRCDDGHHQHLTLQDSLQVTQKDPTPQLSTSSHPELAIFPSKLLYIFQFLVGTATS